MVLRDPVADIARFPAEKPTTGLFETSFRVIVIVAFVPTIVLVGFTVTVEFSMTGSLATIARVPKFVAPVTPEILDPPVFVIFPDTRGDAEIGRTLIFCHVKLLRLPKHSNPKFVLSSVTAKVICEDVLVTDSAEPLAALLILQKLFCSSGNALTRDTSTVGDAPDVSNSKPAGALRRILPVPISPAVDSVITGPVNVVQLVVPAEDAGIAVPPVAGATVVAAWAMLIKGLNVGSTMLAIARTANNFFIYF
jgi:hypothetical protein